MNNTVEINQSKFWESDFMNFLILLILGCLVYFPLFTNDLTNWDDISYILENPFIKTFNSDNLKSIWSTYYMGNYHPLTMCSYLIEYQCWGSNGIGYHIVSLLLHIINSCLVYQLINKITLSKKSLGLYASIIFLVHPFHVESVAWASERKDLLYVLFLLISSLYFIKYCKINNRKYYYFSLFGFLLSCFSKGQAVVLPILLFIIGFFCFNKKALALLKSLLPFFIIAAIFGIIAIKAQGEAIRENDGLLGYERIFIASFGLTQYIIKFIFPHDFIPQYDYPSKTNGSLPYVYYLSILTPVIILGLILLIYKNSKEYLWAILFFILAIFPVLQLFPVGNAFMADRYIYLPMAGLCYLTIYFLNKISFVKNKLLIYIPIFIVLGYLNYIQTQYWKSGISLWTHQLTARPENLTGLFNRGNAYVSLKDYNNAKIDFEKSINLYPSYAGSFSGMGIIYMEKELVDSACLFFEKALSLESDNLGALSGKSFCLAYSGNFDNAFDIVNKVLERDPFRSEAYNIRGKLFSYKGDIKAAEEDYKKAIYIKEDLGEPYYNLGFIYSKQGDHFSAKSNYLLCIKYAPTFYRAFHNLGLTEQILGDTISAINYYRKALKYKSDYSSAKIKLANLLIIKNNPEGCIILRTMTEFGDTSVNNLYLKNCKNK